MKIVAVICEYCKQLEKVSKRDIKVVLRTYKTILPLSSGDRWEYETTGSDAILVRSCCEADVRELFPYAYSKAELEARVSAKLADFAPGKEYTMISFLE